jgi:branched-chain amino acid transport system substrate-binding protein
LLDPISRIAGGEGLIRKAFKGGKMAKLSAHPVCLAWSRRYGILNLLTAGLLAMFVIAACGDDDDDDETAAEETETEAATGDGTEEATEQAEDAEVDFEEETIKIGTNAELSGPLKNPVTDSAVAGIRIAIEDINEEGGVEVNGSRYRLEYVEKDNRGEATGVLSVAEELVEEGVLGAWAPSFQAFDAHYQTFNEAGRITFGSAPIVTLPLLIDPAANPLLFGTFQTAPTIIAGWLAQLYAAHPDISRVAILNQNDETGVAMRDIIQSLADEFGFEVVAADLVPPDQTDLSAELTSIRSAGADILYLGIQAQILAGIQQAIDLEAVPIIWTFALPATEIAQIDRDFGNTLLYQTDFRVPFTPDLVPPEFEEFIGHLADGGVTNMGAAIAQYDFIRNLVQAIEDAQTIDDVEAITQALIGQEYQSPFGVTRILDDQASEGPQGNIQVSSGGILIFIYPSVTSAEPSDEFEFPAP